jgi:hypothetical protein
LLDKEFEKGDTIIVDFENDKFIFKKEVKEWENFYYSFNSLYV